MIMIADELIQESTFKLLQEAGYRGEERPTQTAAVKWLRYERDLSVEPISTRPHGDRLYRVFLNSNVTLENAEFETYEKAAEYGIIQAAKMLKAEYNHKNDIQ